MSRAAIWIVAGLLASGAVLVGVELAKGALDEPSPKIANPCEPREGRTGGFDTTVQRIVLDGLDGAACRLHTTREELVLSLEPRAGVDIERLVTADHTFSTRNDLERANALCVEWLRRLSKGP